MGSLCHVLKSHCFLGYNVEFEAETVKKYDNFVGVCCASLIMRALAIFILVFVSNWPVLNSVSSGLVGLQAYTASLTVY